ncbi:hypothetical protein AVEN_55162-1 [Araneus ventricosus]|uniref:Uncharacterized protein n=1 Tax=Araneus ventricosus TaxID=182803 RepID=A0A4Y2HLS0_ARAVE|nr:hypothetical protein AVEN_55162-1 [Araneus ventricosus]
MDLPEHIRMDITTDNLPPNSISYASARMKSCSTGPMKSLNFPPYSKSSKEWEYASGPLKVLSQSWQAGSEWVLEELRKWLRIPREIPPSWQHCRESPL